MFPRKITSFIFIVIAPLVIWSCGSSAEYTSAKMAIEKSNWAEAEVYSADEPQLQITRGAITIKMNDVIFLGNILTLNNLILNIIRTYIPTQVESRI
jgi:hypothetical protein